MKFSIKTAYLKNAIGKVERIVTKQSTLPILGNILISTEKGGVVIASTNLEIAIKTLIRAKIEEKGSITVPVRIISGFLNNIKDEEVDIELKDLNLKLSTPKHKIVISGMNSDDFPIIPDNPQNYLIKTKKITQINEAINATLISVAKNDTRQELNGVFWGFQENKIVLASTDSYRLTEAVINLDKDELNEEVYNVFIQENPSLIIPNLTFLELQRILDGDEDELSFNIDQNQLFIKSGDTYIISRLINGNYPEYKQIIPKEYKIVTKIRKDDFLDALKVNSLFLDGTNNEIKIKSNKNEIVTSSQSEGLGSNVSKVKAENKGGDFEIILNCRYLMDGLGIFSNTDEYIELRINDQKTPVLIQRLKKDKSELDEKLSYIVMPIIKD